MREFAENPEGVHLMGSVAGGEFTVCGDSFDMFECEGEGSGPLHPTTKKTVTCPRCIAVIQHCRGVRVQPTGSET